MSAPVFAYGTLRGDYCDAGDRWGMVTRTGASWRHARVRGYQLYQQVGRFYPFAFRSGDEADFVVGTLLIWPSEEVGLDGVKGCDRIEGYDPAKPDNGLYLRSGVEVELLSCDGGSEGSVLERMPALIYHQRLDGRTNIRFFPEGDWSVTFGTKRSLLSGGVTLAKGSGVRVVSSVRTNNRAKKMTLPIASEGIAHDIDDDGDALIDFGHLGRHWIQAEDFDKLTAPRPMLKAFDLEGFADYMQEHRCTRVVVLCGAGISTSAGIPDFRTLYATLGKTHDLPQPRSIFEIDYFRQNPEPFYELARDMWPGGHLQPTICHHFIRLLHEKGVLLRCFTQNIDSLELQAGLPAEKLVQAHGNFHSAHIIDTDPEVVVDASELKAAIDGNTCDDLRRRKGGLVKPKISFYGEPLMECFFELRGDLEDCDMLLVLGTALEVSPFNKLVGQAHAAAPRLLVNRDAVGLCDDLEQGFRFHLPGSNWRDAFHEGDIDAAVSVLAGCLGWTDDLEDVIAGRSSHITAAPWVGDVVWTSEASVQGFHGQIGFAVCTTRTMVSNNAHNAWEIPVGSLGTVRAVDEDGDVQVEFADWGRQWIQAKHFDRLRFVESPAGQS